jgi:hypothetical protein
MKKTNVLKQCTFIVSRLCLLLLIGVVSSCQQDEEIIALEEENMEVDLLADTSQYKTYHDISGKDGEVIGRLNDELEYVNEAGDVVQKTSDTSEALGVVFYQHSSFNGTKQVKYHGGHDLYLRNSSFVSALKTGITGVYVGPHCSVELYSQDNWGNKIRTINGGSDGYAVHYLGNQNDDTRSAIIKCDYVSARNRFLGFIHEHTNYSGRSIPLFTRTSSYIPNAIPGFTDVGISSVSMNRYHDNLNPIKNAGVVITDANNPNTESPIILHNDIDIPHLQRLNNRRLIFDAKTVTLKNSQIAPAIAAFEIDNGGNKETITRDQLSYLCDNVVESCWAQNAKYEIGTGVGVTFCTVAFSQVKSALIAAQTYTGVPELIIAINDFGFTAVTAGALSTSMTTFMYANPYVATLATAGLAGCIYSYYKASQIPALQDCGDLRTKCMDTRYFHKTICSDCPGS